MSAERDAGLAAMQSGDTNTAIQQLEIATQQNPGDYQAAMYLGAAYGQAQRHTDAVGVLTRAVQIEPANPQARYNLGIAMEQGGWTEQAKQAYEQAITLQPDYAKAQEALGRTQALLSPQPSFTIDPMNMPTTALSPQQTGYAPSQPTQQMPAQPQPVYAPPMQQPQQQGYGQQPPAYGQPPQPAYGAPPSPYGGTLAAPSPYGAPPSPYPQPGGNYPAQAQYHPDSFSIKDAFRDWKEVLFAPRAFWRRQADSDGLSAPLAMNLTFLSTFLLVIFLSVSLFIGLHIPMIIPFLLIAFLIYAVVGGVLVLLYQFAAAGVLYLVSKMFGGRGTYAGSFRSITYAHAPYLLYITLGTAVMMPIIGSAVTPIIEEARNSAYTRSTTTVAKPGTIGRVRQPRAERSSDFSASMTTSRFNEQFAAKLGSFIILGILFYIGVFGVLLWMVILLGVGIAHTQKLSTGGAIGTVIVGYILPGLLLMFLMSSISGR